MQMFENIARYLEDGAKFERQQEQKRTSFIDRTTGLPMSFKCVSGCGKLLKCPDSLCADCLELAAGACRLRFKKK